jgi:hypothetical protein
MGRTTAELIKCPHIEGMMFKPWAGWIISFWMAAFIGPAFAEVDAQTFLKGYDGSGPDDRATLARILGATENGIAWTISAVKHDHGIDVFCTPNKLALTDQQDVDILRRYVQVHPKDGTYPYGLVLLMALRDAFPCK